MHTSANGRSTSGRANYAKKPSTNKDPQVADVHQQQDSEEGPPAKKRRTDTSHDSAIGDAAVTRAKSGNLVEPGKTWKTRKSLSIDQLERIGPRPLTEPPPGKQHKNDVRVLRSQDGTGHGTSALSAYFEEYYNEVFGGEDSSPFVDVDSSIYLVEESPPLDPASSPKSSLPLRSKLGDPSSSPKKSPKKKTATAKGSQKAPASPSQHPTFTSSTIDLAKYEDEARSLECDPLEDEYYRRSHARGERLERQYKNQEKEKTAHEKPQLESLLEELQGSEWWRTMGIQNLSEAERQKFAPKRDIYIKKVRGLLARFEAYKQKEERLAQKRKAKLERQQAEADGERRSHKSRGKIRARRSMSDLDPSAQQLHAEAGLKLSMTKKITLRMPEKARSEVIETKPFVSFFAKPHERTGALSSHRRGRHILAFGLPLPDMPDEQDFELPEAMLEQSDQQHRKSPRRKRMAEWDAA